LIAALLLPLSHVCRRQVLLIAAKQVAKWSLPSFPRLCCVCGVLTGYHCLCYEAATNAAAAAAAAAESASGCGCCQEELHSAAIYLTISLLPLPHVCRRQVLLTAAKQVAKWSLPSFVCRDNVGVANIGSRTAMVEARCSRSKGKTPSTVTVLVFPFVMAHWFLDKD
jgi:hypothetical protein